MVVELVLLLLSHICVIVVTIPCLSMLKSRLLYRLNIRRQRRELSGDTVSLCSGLLAGLRSGGNLPEVLLHLVESHRCRGFPLLFAEKILNGQQRGLSFESSVQRSCLALANEPSYLPLRAIGSALIAGVKFGASVIPLLEEGRRQVERDRRLRAKCIAVTAQIRLQGICIALIPLASALFLSLFKPQTVSFFFFSPVGRILGGVIFVLNLVGFMWMNRLCRLEHLE